MPSAAMQRSHSGSGSRQFTLYRVSLEHAERSRLLNLCSKQTATATCAKFEGQSKIARATEQKHRLSRSGQTYPSISTSDSLPACRISQASCATFFKIDIHDGSCHVVSRCTTERWFHAKKAFLSKARKLKPSAACGLFRKGFQISKRYSRQNPTCTA